MAIRNTTLITKHSDIVNRPLPPSLLAGEAIVNTAEGILLFSGVTSSTNEWTPAGTGTTASFFEVGSNLYDLRLRNKITKYEGKSSSELVGKFLSGTTEGFVLANITDIGGISSFTYDPTLNRFRITQSSGTQLDTFITSVSGLTVNGNLNVTGTETVNQLTITGTSVYNLNATGTNPFELVNYGVLTAFTEQNDVYVSGATYDGATNNTNSTTFNLLYAGNLTTGPHSFSGTDTFVTGGTYNNSNALITFLKNDGSNFGVDLSALDLNDTFVTGITYNSSTNTITLFRNEGQPNLTASINQFSGITLNNLTAGRVVYVGTNGLLTDESGFEYNDGTNTFTVGNIFVNNPSGTTANIGQGGLEIGSGGSTSTPGVGNLVVHGDLTVFGTETIISTTDLYVEDPQIELNYNPTGDTSFTSIGAGIRIQDGGGVAGQDVKIGIGQLQGSSISGNTTEYTATTGFTNRGWITQLNDIVIRATSPIIFGAPTGVRVLAEGDSLDGGTY